MADLLTGTTLGTSATLPATFDAPGYSVLTFTAIGKVIDIGELAKAYNVISHQEIGNDHPEKLKDTYDIANVTITVARDSTDAGQVLMQTALGVTASYSFEIVLPSGNTGAFTAKVIKSGMGAVASGSVSTTMIELAIDPNTLFEA